MEPLSLDVMRSVARLQGFEWTDAELEALRPTIETTRRLLARLETAPVDAIDPTTQFRVF